MTPERIKGLRGLLDAEDAAFNAWQSETGMGTLMAWASASAEAEDAVKKALPDILTLAERALSAEAERDEARDANRNLKALVLTIEAREQALREALKRIRIDVGKYGDRLLDEAEHSAATGASQAQFAATAGAGVIAAVLDIYAKHVAALAQGEKADD